MDWKNLSKAEKLKLTTYLAVSKTCDDLGKDNTLLGQFTVNTQAKHLMTEFVCYKMKTYAQDLEAFAQHAKRNTINCEDVRLLFRRNEKMLDKFAEMDKEEEPEGTSNKRKRINDDNDDQ